ncbi:MAG: EAL domain-containing protein [Halocynthiibacter sp.]
MSIREIFSPENEPDNPLDFAIAEKKRRILQVVQDALLHKRVQLAYQPIVKSSNPTVPAYYEGLIRIQNDAGQVISAKHFIETIEDTEFGRVIDCLSLELGLKALRISPDLRLAINMSAKSIGHVRWIETLDDALTNSPEIANRLILEITESSAMENPELVVSFMDHVHQYGVTFALDDFGSGQTCFRYLRDFFFDILKIDKDFIQGVHNNADNQVLTQALIGIAQSFDIFTVAEGVETQEDANYLIGAGIDCMQGYYFGRPNLTPPWHSNYERQRA